MNWIILNFSLNRKQKELKESGIYAMGETDKTEKYERI